MSAEKPSFEEKEISRFNRVGRTLPPRLATLGVGIGGAAVFFGTIYHNLPEAIVGLGVLTGSSGAKVLLEKRKKKV